MIFVDDYRINFVRAVCKRKEVGLIKNRVRALSVGIVTGILSTVVCVPTAVWADGLLETVTPLETTADYAEDTSYSLLRGNNLASGTTKITKLSSNEINIYGLTQCHHECDNVYLELYLEQKVDGSYGTYQIWQFEDEDVTSLEISMNVAVPSGHYYRVRGYHAAKDGSKESTSTLTSGIWVG